MADDVAKMAERYIQEMKKAAGEAQRGIERAAQEMDRVGRMMYDDVKQGVQGPGSALNNIKDRMAEDLNREMPHMMEEMRRLENRMERYVQEMQEEVRRLTKK
ncbi:MAG: hypothetical protein A4E32_00674 [Methanomassiliicoccales archaeon PtaU1.Bin124]|nr:MAG: hypothetical protein A4E32_00674 [Methanomassiliicoccales archaeon PtaU1.Bin124]